MPLLYILAAVVGYITGVHTPLSIQLILLVVGIIYLNTNYVKQQELGALFHMAMVVFFFIGVFIADFIFVVFILPPGTFQEWILKSLKTLFVPR